MWDMPTWDISGKIVKAELGKIDWNSNGDLFCSLWN